MHKFQKHKCRLALLIHSNLKEKTLLLLNKTNVHIPEQYNAYFLYFLETFLHDDELRLEQLKFLIKITKTKFIFKFIL